MGPGPGGSRGRLRALCLGALTLPLLFLLLAPTPSPYTARASSDGAVQTASGVLNPDNTLELVVWFADSVGITKLFREVEVALLIGEESSGVVARLEQEGGVAGELKITYFLEGYVEGPDLALIEARFQGYVVPDRGPPFSVSGYAAVSLDGSTGLIYLNSEAELIGVDEAFLELLLGLGPGDVNRALAGYGVRALEFNVRLLSEGRLGVVLGFQGLFDPSPLMGFLGIKSIPRLGPVELRVVHEEMAGLRSIEVNGEVGLGAGDLSSPGLVEGFIAPLMSTLNPVAGLLSKSLGKSIYLEPSESLLSCRDGYCMLKTPKFYTRDNSRESALNFVEGLARDLGLRIPLTAPSIEDSNIAGAPDRLPAAPDDQAGNTIVNPPGEEPEYPAPTPIEAREAGGPGRMGEEGSAPVEGMVDDLLRNTVNPKTASIIIVALAGILILLTLVNIGRRE